MAGDVGLLYTLDLRTYLGAAGVVKKPFPFSRVVHDSALVLALTMFALPEAGRLAILVVALLLPLPESGA